MSYMAMVQGLGTAVVENTATIAAVAQLLVDKGIISEEELDQMIARVRADIDQKLAADRDEMLRKIAADPTLSFLSKLAGSIE